MKKIKLKFPSKEVVHECELDHTFAKKIAKIAHGEQLFGCIQCGNCSSTCPMSFYMDFTPRKIIGMIKAGFREDVLTNRTIWLCASCYSCSVECPKGIKITEIMYALRREAILNNIHPKGFSVPILSQVFYDEVKNSGRMSETMLMMKYYFKYNIFRAIPFAPLALKLFKTGRLKLFEKKLESRKEIEKILEYSTKN